MMTSIAIIGFMMESVVPVLHESEIALVKEGVSTTSIALIASNKSNKRGEGRIIMITLLLQFLRPLYKKSLLVT